MLRKLFLAALMVGCSSGLYAQKYMTRTGHVVFDATSPKSPEKIEAVDNEMACIMDAKSGDVIMQVPVKSFKFEKALMQEHFNENYMESDKYPKAEFKGKLANTGDLAAGKDGTYNVTATGKLTIHGVTKDVSVPGTVTVKGKSATLKAKFAVVLKDYNIAVPNVVADKINKDATITVDTELKGM